VDLNQLTKLHIQHPHINHIIDETSDPQRQDQVTPGLPVELDGGRQRAQPFENGNVHRLSFYIIVADQHGNEQHRHHQVLGEGRIDRAPVAFDPPQSTGLIKL
jgi:hypothetical protein